MHLAAGRLQGFEQARPVLALSGTVLHAHRQSPAGALGHASLVTAQRPAWDPSSKPPASQTHWGGCQRSGTGRNGSDGTEFCPKNPLILGHPGGSGASPATPLLKAALAAQTRQSWSSSCTTQQRAAKPAGRGESYRGTLWFLGLLAPTVFTPVPRSTETPRCCACRGQMYEHTPCMHHPGRTPSHPFANLRAHPYPGS